MSERYAVVEWREDTQERFELAVYPTLYDTRDLAAWQVRHFSKPGVIYGVARVTLVEDDPHDVPDEDQP